MLAYPKLSELYEDRQQEALLNQWEAAFEAIDAADPGVEPTASELDGMPDAAADIGEAGANAQTVPAAEPLQQIEGLEGMLHIEKIDLKLPILKGATAANLKKGAASIDDTGEPGEVGNYAVAGHRNRTFGRNFNRLDELEAGDMIEVDNGGDIFRYEVTEKLYVKPNEVWVLEAKGGLKEITLVTCHPLGKSTHRLIVKGKMI